MKAFVLRSYGPPDVLELQDVAKPVPAGDEVLVRVRATSVNPWDWHLMRGQPYAARLIAAEAGLRHPKLSILGCDMSGQVEATGPDATAFRPGDDVFALLLQGGGFGEYVSVPEGLLARKPSNLSYEQAAAVPMAGITALLAVRERGAVQPGQKVLVNGASGGVGTFAVQLARALGASVAGVCGPRNVDLVRSVGADEVVDYSSEDFTRRGERYDLLLDIAGSRGPLACRRALTPRGRFVIIGGPAGRWLQPAGHAFSALAMGPLVSQRVVMADAVGSSQPKQNLVTLTGLIEDGKVTPVIDRCYPFTELPDGVSHSEAGHARGKVVVTV
jgi:NADPH:quinone reductase-like Zn-dependent oxidoreductase